MFSQRNVVLVYLSWTRDMLVP